VPQARRPNARAGTTHRPRRPAAAAACSGRRRPRRARWLQEVGATPAQQRDVALVLVHLLRGGGGTHDLCGGRAHGASRGSRSRVPRSGEKRGSAGDTAATQERGGPAAQSTAQAGVTHHPRRRTAPRVRHQPPAVASSSGGQTRPEAADMIGDGHCAGSGSGIRRSWILAGHGATAHSILGGHIARPAPSAAASASSLSEPRLTAAVAVAALRPAVRERRASRPP
jgi:hypothetical protein